MVCNEFCRFVKQSILTTVSVQNVTERIIIKLHHGSTVELFAVVQLEHIEISSSCLQFFFMLAELLFLFTGEHF